jgi:hypothetical protein
MAANLIDTVKGLITPDVVDKAAASTGESPANASKALHGAVPTIFAALAHRSSTPEGASAVMGMIQTGAPSGIIDKLGGFLGRPRPSTGGQGLVGAIFGDRAESAGEALASSSGVKSSSIPKILELAAPLVAGVLGKEVVSRGMNAGGLSQLLSSHKAAALGEAPHAPPGLSESSGTRPASEIEARPTSELEAKPVSQTTAPATTGSRFRDMEERAVSRFRHVERQAATRFRDVEQRAAVTAKHSPRKLIVPALAVLGMVIVGIIASTRSHAPREGVTAMQPSAPATPSLRAPEVPALPAIQAPAAPAAPAPGAAPLGITLPDGKTLETTRGGRMRMAPGKPEAGAKANRRAEIVILSR